jgi:hypothetical protein
MMIYKCDSCKKVISDDKKIISFRVGWVSRALCFTCAKKLLSKQGWKELAEKSLEPSDFVKSINKRFEKMRKR